MATLNIHIETFDEKSFDGVESLAKKGPIAISFAPYQIPLLKESQIIKLKKILSQEGYVLGQQGLNHKCNKCVEFQRQKKDGQVIKSGIDPWHENYCLWLGEIPAKEQESFMKEGKEQLKKVFGVEPRLYVPPNHYFDLNTVKIARKLGYKWLTDRTLIALKPYILEGIIIIPEGEPEIQNKNIYIHADRYRGDLNKAISTGIDSLYNIKPEKNSKEDIAQNRKIKYTKKIARDLISGYGMPEENAKQFAELLFNSKFSKDGFI